jgi:hypothetical protein
MIKASVFLTIAAVTRAIVCDDVCIALCDPSAPNGCGSYCCPEFQTLAQSSCLCKLDCAYSQGNYECDQLCDCNTCILCNFPRLLPYLVLIVAVLGIGILIKKNNEDDQKYLRILNF